MSDCILCEDWDWEDWDWERSCVCLLRSSVALALSSAIEELRRDSIIVLLLLLLLLVGLGLAGGGGGVR